MAVIRGTDFPSVRIGDYSAVPIRYLEERHAERKRLRSWDILIETAGGSPDRPTGRTLLITPRVLQSLGPDATCASFARFLRVDPRAADPRYVFWLLQHHYESRNLLQFHTQHTGVARFQFTTFADSFELTIPARQTQERIASILGAYDDLIEVNRRRIAVLEEMARRLFEEWFVHFRFPGHDSSSADARTPPRDWPETAIADVCTWLQAGGTPSRKQSEYWEDGTVDWFTTGELQDCFLFASKERVSATAVRERKARLFPAGTVFMAIYGSPTVGRIGIATAECSSNQAALALWPDERRFGRWFLVHTLIGLRQHFNAISQGAAQQNISKEKVAAAKFPCPPAGLVREFECRVSPVWDLRRTLERQQQKLASSRDLLLPRLVSGDLPVTAAERELEAVA